MGGRKSNSPKKQPHLKFRRYVVPDNISLFSLPAILILLSFINYFYSIRSSFLEIPVNLIVVCFFGAFLVGVGNSQKGKRIKGQKRKGGEERRGSRCNERVFVRVSERERERKTLRATHSQHTPYATVLVQRCAPRGDRLLSAGGQRMGVPDAG